MSEFKENNFCDCYLKLRMLGIPLYIDEENADFAEQTNEINATKAFQFPEVIRIDESVSEYPIVEDNDLIFVFQQMCRVIQGLSDYEVNLLSFWILDVFIEGLWTSQNENFKHEHQKATLLWIAYFFNYIIKENPTRKSLFRHLKEVLFQPVEENNSLNGESKNSFAKGSLEEEDKSWSDSIKKKETWNLPLPPVINGDTNYEEGSFVKSPLENSVSNIKDTEDYNGSTPTEKTASLESVSDINVRHMNVILEILYRIKWMIIVVLAFLIFFSFARIWVFLEIQSSLHNMPAVETVDLPFVFNVPKPLQKPEVSVTTGKEKAGGKKALVPEKSPEEIEAEREEHKNDYILPLQASEEAKAYVAEHFISVTDKKGRDKKK